MEAVKQTRMYRVIETRDSEGWRAYDLIRRGSETKEGHIEYTSHAGHFVFAAAPETVLTAAELREIALIVNWAEWRKEAKVV